MKLKITLALLALAIIVALSATYIVREQQYAIKLKFGEVVDSQIEPGLHWKIPFVNTVRKFDRRILTLDMQPEQMNTLEQKYVDVDYFVNWRIDEVANFYTSTSGGNERVARQRMAEIARDSLREEFAKRTLREVVSVERGAIMNSLQQTMDQSMTDYGISIVDVRIKRIELTDRVTDSVFSRMETQRTEYANELRSMGREEAEKIRSEADRKVQVLLAEARRDAEQIRGEGDAEAIRIYADAYTQDAEFFDFTRSLQAYRNAFSNGNDVLVVDPSSEFFDYFENAQGNEAE